MDQEYTLSYGYKTFTGRIGASVLTIEAESIDIARENAFRIVFDDLVENNKDYISSLNISVEPKS